MNHQYPSPMVAKTAEWNYQLTTELHKFHNMHGYMQMK